MLKYVDKLILPESVGGNVYLNNFESIENLVIPDNLTYNIYVNGFVITPQNADEYKNKQKNIKKV